VLWVVTAIRPWYPRDWLLENLLVFAYAALLAITYRRFAFSNLSYGLFTLFLSLHLVGAHYTYAEVPFGFWLRDALGLARNHYDRIVHFSFGLLIAYPFREVLVRAGGLRPAWSSFMAVVTVLGFSAFYEGLEAVTAMVVSPELGAAYLGTQGDEWDSQKDSVLAMAGSVLAMLVTGAVTRSNPRRAAAL
jgi:putative membrane protein